MWGCPSGGGGSMMCWSPQERPGFYDIFNGIFPDLLIYASAGTVSAQVSSFVRIASSEYEVRFTLCRPKVTM